MYLTHFSVLDRKLYTSFFWIWFLAPFGGYFSFLTSLFIVFLLVLTVIPVAYIDVTSRQLRWVLIIGETCLIVGIAVLFEIYVTEKLGRKSAKLFIRHIKPSIPAHLCQKTLDIWHKEAVDAKHIKEMANYNLIYLFGKHKDKPVLQRWTYWIAKHYPDVLKNSKI